MLALAAPAAASCPPGQPVPVLGPQPPPPARILAIGSSSTEGVGASSPGASYPARLAAHLGIPVENAGRGGERAAETLVRLKALLAADPPDLVIWQVGVNDALDAAVSETAFADTLRAGLSVIRGAGAAPLLLDQQAFPAVHDPARYARFVAIVGEVARAEGAALFPRHAIMSGWDAETLGSMLAADRFHMSDRGYDCLAALIAGALALRP